MLLGLIVASCSDDPAPDRIKGSYNCVTRLDTRYKKGDQWRDTAYISKSNNSVIIKKIDDNHVSIQASSKKWGTIEVATAEADDFNYAANVAGLGSLSAANGQTYDANVTGTVSYESHAMTISARISDYPNSYGKYILTWYNTTN